jgi:hypothetical protein
VLLLWVTHSTLIVSARNFREITRKVYLPLFTIIVMFYFAINIKMLVPEEVFEKQKIWNYGFFKFSNSFAEVLLLQMFLITIFFWVKQQENVSYLDENLSYQGVRFFRYMSQKSSYTF